MKFKYKSLLYFEKSASIKCNLCKTTYFILVRNPYLSGGPRFLYNTRNNVDYCDSCINYLEQTDPDWAVGLESISG